MQFPTWLYHKEHGARLFETADAVAAAGKGWQDAPHKEAPEQKRKSKGE